MRGKSCSSARATPYHASSAQRTILCDNLVKAKLLESPRRGYFRITDRGINLVQQPPKRLDAAFLRKNYEEFRSFVGKPVADTPTEIESTASPLDDTATPEESLEAAYQTLRRTVENELTAKLQACSPAFFERVVVQLLVKMGYGGSLQDAGAAIGRSGDEGVDGIIKEDRLGLDVVYVQAKRWAGTVGRPENQKFAGALQGQRARKGVFITTSTFTPDAKSFVAQIGRPLFDELLPSR